MTATIEALRRIAADAARILRFMSPAQFAEHIRDVREIGELLQDTLDHIDENETE